MEDYKGLNKSSDSGRIEIKKRSELKKIYFEFLHDFKDNLAEYVKQSMVELCVTELPVSTKPVKLFNGDSGGMQVVLKNQGNIECYISTLGMGGFRLDPGDKERIWLNQPLTAVTPSGSTTIGLIRT